MTVYRPLGSQATLAADAAVTLAKGDAVKTTAGIPVGNSNIPAIFMALVAVAKENVPPPGIKDGVRNLDTIADGPPQNKSPTQHCARMSPRRVFSAPQRGT